MILNVVYGYDWSRLLQPAH